jgi:hypothetical protein
MASLMDRDYPSHFLKGMTVMFELMELGTCRYRKIKSSFIYLHVNPNESATNTSPHPFWTKRGFDPVNETLVITPLTATDDANPVLRNQQAVKTTAQAEVLAGVKELCAHFIIHPQDGKQTDDDEGMVIYSRRHTKECTVVHALTDETRDAILAEAARKAEEEQAGEDTPQESEDQPPDNDDDDETETEEAKTKREAARSVAKEQYIKANEDVYEADNAHKKAQATCTKNNKAVELAHKRIKAAENAKTKADKVHATSFLQLDVLVEAFEAAKSLVTEAENSKATGQEL